MYLSQYTEATWCKIFPTTLVGIAQSWFSKGLENGSVTGYNDLVSKFRAKFVSSNRREKTTAELIGVKQNHDESLRDFLTRFSSEAAMITDLRQDVATFALQSGL